jgi:hypothetical protein
MNRRTFLLHPTTLLTTRSAPSKMISNVKDEVINQHLFLSSNKQMESFIVYEDYDDIVIFNHSVKWNDPITREERTKLIKETYILGSKST